MEKTKVLENAALWVDSEIGSFRLAKCNAKIVISEDIRTLKLSGRNIEYKVKTYNAALILCDDINSLCDRKINPELLKEIKKFDLKFSPFETTFNDCKISVKDFTDITPVEIDLNGEWRFDVTKHLDTIKGLFPNLIFD